MKKKVILIIIIFLLLFITACGRKEGKEKVEKLLEITKSESYFNKMLSDNTQMKYGIADIITHSKEYQELPEYQKAQKQKIMSKQLPIIISDIFSWDKFKEIGIDVYLDCFSDAELDLLIELHTNPLLAKINQEIQTSYNGDPFSSLSSEELQELEKLNFFSKLQSFSKNVQKFNTKLDKELNKYISKNSSKIEKAINIIIAAPYDIEFAKQDKLETERKEAEIRAEYERKEAEIRAEYERKEEEKKAYYDSKIAERKADQQRIKIEQQLKKDAIIEKYYTINEDTSLTDKMTGLQWQRCSVGQTWNPDTQTCDGKATELDWEAANILSKHEDWRLPTIDELKTLFYCSEGQRQYKIDGSIDEKNGCVNAFMIQEAFPKPYGGGVRGGYWSSSSSLKEGFQWYIQFHGYCDKYASKKTDRYYVRLVRNGSEIPQNNEVTTISDIANEPVSSAIHKSNESQVLNNSFLPSFDCTKASTVIEKLICSNKDLSDADANLAQAYKNALNSATDKTLLKKSQREWLKNERNNCSDVPCLLQSYKNRINQLSN